MDEGKRWHSITFKDTAVGHFYEDKNDVSMQMLISMFSIYISKMFPFICPWPWLTRAQKLLWVSPGPNGNISLLFCTRDCRKHKTAMHLLTNSSCNLCVQTLDCIILLISSSFLWIICGLLSSVPVLSSWCGKTHQESISRLCPCVSQSKSGASSSSPTLLAELFTSHWCGGWPAVLLVNYSSLLSS